MLDKLLIGSGFVQVELCVLRNLAVIPLVLIGILLVKGLPDIIAPFAEVTGERADIGKLIRKPQHLHSDIVALF